MLIKHIRAAMLPLKARWLAAACRRIERSNTVPSSMSIAALAMAWGNPGYAAGVSYLKHVGQRVSEARGPILECGSGATTLLMAAITRRHQNPLVVLEHNAVWYRYMRQILQRLGYDHVRLIHAPLQAYGDYHWYQVSTSALPADIAVVICDGPPGSIPGGRYGLMPITQTRLADDCIILLDDTHREAERKIISAWKNYRALQAQRLGHRGSHAEVRCLGPKIGFDNSQGEIGWSGAH